MAHGYVWRKGEVVDWGRLGRMEIIDTVRSRCPRDFAGLRCKRHTGRGPGIAACVCSGYSVGLRDHVRRWRRLKTGEEFITWEPYANVGYLASDPEWPDLVHDIASLGLAVRLEDSRFLPDADYVAIMISRPFPWNLRQHRADLRDGLRAAT